MTLLDPAIRRALRPVLMEMHGSGAHLFEEVGLERGHVIADFLVADGRLHAYEVKSDGDSLARLERQLTTYGLIAATATLVVGETHAQAAERRLPQWWGLLSVTDGPEGVAFVRGREALTNPTRVPAAIARLLWNAELLSMLRAAGASKGLPNTRAALCQRACEHLTLPALEAEVCRRLAQRGAAWSWRKTAVERSLA